MRLTPGVDLRKLFGLKFTHTCELGHFINVSSLRRIAMKRKKNALLDY